MSARGGSIEAFDKGPESDGVVHAKGEWSYLDPERHIGIIEQSSQPVSKDAFLNGYDLNAFYAIVSYLSKK